MQFRSTFVALVPLGALWLLQNFVGERFGITALWLYLPQHLWALWPLGFVAFGLCKRHREPLLAGLMALLFWSHFLLGFRFLGSLGNGNRTPNSVRLMSYNIARGAGGIDALERAIRAQNPDIVCLQESQGAYGNHVYSPGARIAARFPGWSMAQSGDVMTISRFPIISKRESVLRGTRRILETTLATPRGAVRIINLHVATSFKGQSFPPVGRLERITHVAANAKPSAQARLGQIAPIQKAIAAGSRQTPLLVVGDFNSPPRGLFFNAISRNLSDTWQSGGRGTGSTFPSNFPLLPIDHVLARGVSIERAFVPAVHASDHRPMIVDWHL